MNWIAFVSEQWLLIGILALLVAGLVVVERRRAGKSISLHEVTRLVNDDKAVLVDVRDPKEFSAGHIVDSVNIPFAKLRDRAVELEKHRKKTIVVLDKMGQHSGAAFKVLAESGYDVARMQGGITEWQNQNLPLVKA